MFFTVMAVRLKRNFFGDTKSVLVIGTAEGYDICIQRYINENIILNVMENQAL